MSHDTHPCWQVPSGSTQQPSVASAPPLSSSQSTIVSRSGTCSVSFTIRIPSHCPAPHSAVSMLQCYHTATPLSTRIIAAPRSRLFATVPAPCVKADNAHVPIGSPDTYPRRSGAPALLASSPYFFAMLATVPCCYVTSYRVRCQARNSCLRLFIRYRCFG